MRIVAASWLSALACAGWSLAPAPRALAEPIAGIDHIPVVVRDVDRAARDFARLGFAVKPGRPHANGIRNAHVKFPDGSGIELIHAPAPVDALTRRYAELLAGGEGAAFVSFHVRDFAKLARALGAAGIESREADGVVTLADPRLAFVFFVRDNRSPTDRPEHFAHANTAVAMSGVWLAPDAPDAVERLMTALGARKSVSRGTLSVATDVTAYALDNGTVYVMPAAARGSGGKPIVGASFTVRDLAAAERALARAEVPKRADPDEATLRVEPGHAHGVSIAFGAR